MSYEILKKGEWPHEHSYPPAGTEPPGTIIRCDCGRRFMLIKDASWDAPIWKLVSGVPSVRPTEERA